MSNESVMKLTPQHQSNLPVREKAIRPVIENATSNIYYSALTAFGEVAIRLNVVNTRFTGNSAVSSQMYLGRLERAIRSLEDWMQTPLDPRPTRAEPDLPHVMTIIMDGDPDLTVHLYLPIEFIESSANNNTTFNTESLQIHWTKCHVKVVLGNISVPQQESILIAPQATVLIPQSFEQRWEVSLKVPKGHAQVFGELETPQMSWTPSGRIERYISDDPSVSETEIVTYCKFSMENWLLEADSLNQVVTSKLSEENISFYCSDGRKVIGFLLPVGHGAGIRVTHVIAPLTAQE